MPKIAVGPNGDKLVLENGKWVPMRSEAAPRALPSMPTAAAAEQDSMVRQGMKTFAGDLVANAIGLPRALGEVLALGGAAVRTGAGGLAAAARGEPMNLGERFQRAREAETDVLSVLPEPTGADVLNSVGVEEATNPIAKSAGRTAADVTTLLALRPSARIAQIFKSRKPAATAADAETRGFLDKAANTLRPLLEGGKKTVEAGFDGAVIGALGEGDPAVTAAWSAGIQAGGSAALAAKGWVFKNPVKNFLTLVIGHEMFKAVAPGPQDIFDSKDMAIDEMVAAYGLGITAALAGAGRGADGQRFVNALSRSSRGGIASVVTQLQEAAKDGKPEYERVLGKIASDPDYFGPEFRNRLERAAGSSKPDALTQEIDRLMKNTRFRKRFEEMNQQSHRTGGGF